jgi:hypothetical protein
MNVFSELFSTFGFVILVGFIFGGMLLFSAADLVLTALQRPTVGDYVNAAVSTRRWIAMMVAIVFGAMIAHFFIFITLS